MDGKDVKYASRGRRTKENDVTIVETE